MPIVASLVLLVTTLPAAWASDDLILSVLVHRAVYVDREPLTLSLVLRNVSQEPLTINRRLAYPGPDLMLEITDLRGLRLRWVPAPPPPPLTAQDFIRLNPGEQLHVTLPDIESRLFDRLGAGEYKLSATYWNHESGSQWHYAAWTGSVTSRLVGFRKEGSR